ncbi:MAG: velvet factor-domain-containing protein [Benjaminiella poitrasii]|nr:MAG: velvet factor-domain-containing protein [Benjaminiella poitrasii]
MTVNIVFANDDYPLLLPPKDYLSDSTTIISSLYQLKDMDDAYRGFFIFHNLSVKKPGQYRFYFSLFEIMTEKIQNRKNIVSNTFTVYTAKEYPGPLESTLLSRLFSNQGIKRLHIHYNGTLKNKNKKRYLNIHTHMYIMVYVSLIN